MSDRAQKRSSSLASKVFGSWDKLQDSGDPVARPENEAAIAARIMGVIARKIRDGKVGDGIIPAHAAARFGQALMRRAEAERAAASRADRTDAP